MFYFHRFLHLDLQRVGIKQSVDAKFTCLKKKCQRGKNTAQNFVSPNCPTCTFLQKSKERAFLNTDWVQFQQWASTQLTNLSPIYTCTNCQLSIQRARKSESITTDQLSISAVHIMKTNPIFIISHLLQPRMQLGEVDSLFEMEKIMENIIDFTLQMAIQMVSVSFS